MNQNNEFIVNEWEWLKLQLRVSALENQGSLWTTKFSFSGDKIGNYQIVCAIYNGKMREILEDVKSKEQLLEEYFDGWVILEKERIGVVLNELPKLRQEIDLESDVLFEIRKDNITSSSLICSVVGNVISWNPNFIF